MSIIVSDCTLNNIKQAAMGLKYGALVAFPTETVYGLGADAENEAAINRMYQVKNRPKDHPVIVHIADLDDVEFWAEDLPDYAIELMREFWPGPMTLLLHRSANVGNFLTGNQEVIGIRIPNHTLALTLLSEFKKVGGHGIAAPSANRYGAVSPTIASAVEMELKPYLHSDDLILDGGPCLVGVESTIIDCTTNNPRILRPGAITKEMIEASTGISVQTPEGEFARVSGSNEKHYAPKAKVEIATTANPNDGFIALKEIATPVGAVRLAQPVSLEDYARQLYSALRKGDDLGLNKIVIVPPDGDGLAIAIRDRINRAAS